MYFRDRSESLNSESTMEAPQISRPLEITGIDVSFAAPTKSAQIAVVLRPVEVAKVAKTIVIPKRQPIQKKESFDIYDNVDGATAAAGGATSSRCRRTSRTPCARSRTRGTS